MTKTTTVMMMMIKFVMMMLITMRMIVQQDTDILRPEQMEEKTEATMGAMMKAMTEA